MGDNKKSDVPTPTPQDRPAAGELARAPELARMTQDGVLQFKGDPLNARPPKDDSRGKSGAGDSGGAKHYRMSQAEWMARGHEDAHISASQIGDIARDPGDVPKNLEPAAFSNTPEKVLQQKHRMEQGAATRAQRAQEARDRPPLSKQEQAQAAKDGARNWAIDKAASALSENNPLGPAIRKEADELKAPEPPSTPTDLRGLQQKENYEDAKTTLGAIELGLSVVVPMIGETALEMKADKALSDKVGDAAKLRLDRAAMLPTQEQRALRKEMGDLKRDIQETKEIQKAGADKVANEGLREVIEDVIVETEGEEKGTLTELSKADRDKVPNDTLIRRLGEISNGGGPMQKEAKGLLDHMGITDAQARKLSEVAQKETRVQQIRRALGLPER